MAASLHQLLKVLVEMGGTDLHLTTNAPPTVRVDGKLRPLDLEPLSAVETKQLAYCVLTDAQKESFEKRLQLSFAFGIKGLSRFRAQVFMQRGAVVSVYREIPYEIRSLKELGLPLVISAICDKPRGLVLVTGGLGSGRSTVLASMIDTINSERHEHILTIEDPIEYLHSHKKAIVNQMELDADTLSYEDALYSGIRSDPDVLLIGEIRGAREASAVMRWAETGHLVFSSIQATSTVEAIAHFADLFSSAQEQARALCRLASVLDAVTCQVLSPKASGTGRCLAVEVLILDDQIRRAIREDRLDRIYEKMRTGKAGRGTRTMNEALRDLYKDKQITRATALGFSSVPAELEAMTR